jgi:hypothetical protein
MLGVEAISMKTPPRSLLLFAPWLVLVVAGAAYAASLVAEFDRFGVPTALVPWYVIPALIVFSLVALAVVAVEQQAVTGRLSAGVRRLVFWIPRASLVAFALFLGLFATDVFGADYDARETAVALFLHLIPTIVLLAAAAVAWRWPRVGTVATISWATFYVLSMWGRFPLSVYVALAVLPLIIGILFCISSTQARSIVHPSLVTRKEPPAARVAASRRIPTEHAQA